MLVADISGFTALTEQLSRAEFGVELLTKCINDFFARVSTTASAVNFHVILSAGSQTTPFMPWPQRLHCMQTCCIDFTLYPVEVMDVVLAYGGDVMKFAGDSVIVAFYATAGEATAPDQGQRSATMRCVRCAAELSIKCGKVLALRLAS